MPTDVQKVYNLDGPMQKFEMRKLTQNICKLKNKITSFKVEDSKKVPSEKRVYKEQAMPNLEKVLDRLPGFEVNSNITKKHYTKGVTVRA